MTEIHWFFLGIGMGWISLSVLALLFRDPSCSPQSSSPTTSSLVVKGAMNHYIHDCRDDNDDDDDDDDILLGTDPSQWRTWEMN